ncbi:MAG: 4-oxalomesaconate tautomerase [Janthinobacterium lividum]
MALQANSVRCMAMRGGTSKGLMFLAEDLPADEAMRDELLLRVMGSPDPRQIDGMGGADPLTSKVAVVGRSERQNCDVDYLFLQVVVDEARVDPNQNCGNMLAAVGPFAIERGLIPVADTVTPVRIHMVNTGALATALVSTPDGAVSYDGTAQIDGVPGRSAPVLLDFEDIAGSSCGALLPTGRARDIVDGIAVTCIDNGMPVVLLRAVDLGCSGYESPAELEANSMLKAKVETVRLACGPLMRLGDVSAKNVPKMCLIATPISGGAISTRNFIPHRVHKTIGVLGAVSVATACALPGSVADGLAVLSSQATGPIRLDVEHPSGFFTVEIEVHLDGDSIAVSRSALLRTARKLMDGTVFAGPEREGADA